LHKVLKAAPKNSPLLKEGMKNLIYNAIDDKDGLLLDGNGRIEIHQRRGEVVEEYFGHDPGLFWSSWSKVPADRQNAAIAAFEAKCPVLGLCSGHFKAALLLSECFASKKRTTKVRKDASATLKRSASDVEDDDDHVDDDEDAEVSQEDQLMANSDDKEVEEVAAINDDNNNNVRPTKKVRVQARSGSGASVSGFFPNPLYF